jgi:hypothetical protein
MPFVSAFPNLSANVASHLLKSGSPPGFTALESTFSRHEAYLPEVFSSLASHVSAGDSARVLLPSRRIPASAMHAPVLSMIAMALSLGLWAERRCSPILTWRCAIASHRRSGFRNRDDVQARGDYRAVLRRWR